ncbi:MAG TPA: DUF4349 domain-containing protein, partial [Blastocatellia bacterium]
QSSLSTITVKLEKTEPPVTAAKAGFGDSVKLAFGDATDFGASIITGLIRLVGILAPITILLVLPGFAGYRLFRRFRRAPAIQAK